MSSSELIKKPYVSAVGVGLRDVLQWRFGSHRTRQAHGDKLARAVHAEMWWFIASAPTWPGI